MRRLSYRRLRYDSKLNGDHYYGDHLSDGRGYRTRRQEMSEASVYSLLLGIALGALIGFIITFIIMEVKK